MKSLSLFTLAAIAAFTSAASAATIVFNFGGVDPTPTATINRVATSNASGDSSNVTVADVLDTTGASTGMSTTATGSAWFSQGALGTFAPLGTAAYDDSNPLVNGWKAEYVSATVGNIWQQGANGDSSPGTMTFTGLQANTAYTFTLLSVRANGFLTDSGTYALNYDGGSAGVTTGLQGAGTLSGNTVTGASTGNGSGLNAREITWSFNTGDTPADAVLNFTGDWNVNAVIIDAVPEPSAALLGAFGLLALLRRRRA